MAQRTDYNVVFPDIIDGGDSAASCTAGDDSSHADFMSTADLSPCRRKDLTAGSIAGSTATSPNRFPRRGATDRPSDDEVRQYCLSGADMVAAVEERAAPVWSSLRAKSGTIYTTKSASRLGEEMLEEQVALDERQRLIRTVKNIHGEELGFRGHVTRNIRQRMEEEKRREAGRGPALQVDQQCINIKKQLEEMAKARGELRGLRSKVQSFSEQEGSNEHGQADQKREATNRKVAEPQVGSESPRDRRGSSSAVRRGSSNFFSCFSKALDVSEEKEREKKELEAKKKAQKAKERAELL